MSIKTKELLKFGILLWTLLFLIGKTGYADTFIVTHTNDTGEGSLRWAIEQTNLNPDPDTILFHIPIEDPGFNGQYWTIQPKTTFPVLYNGGCYIDGFSQEDYAGDNNPSSPELFIDGELLDTDRIGFIITSPNNIISGLIISRFKDFGIRIRNAEAVNNQIWGNYIGTEIPDMDGNGSGIYLSRGCSKTVIGGEELWKHNVISGNYYNGIYIQDSDSNLIVGNLIGTDYTGTVSIPNGLDGKSSGILLALESNYNIIGGPDSNTRNIISGNNRDGIHISHSCNNIIIGNYIGPDITGTINIGNGHCGFGDGIDIRSMSQNNMIGGSGNGERNIICGNPNMGIRILGEGASGNIIRGNYIGTDLTGTQAFGHNDFGVYIYEGSQSNWIGGNAEGEGNVISGNGRYGLFISDAGTDSNRVIGNFIGTDAQGMVRLGNQSHGIVISKGAKHTRIGPGNLISGNNGHGILLSGVGTDSTQITGNWIGLNSTGVDSLSNCYHGIQIEQRSSYNTIGGTLDTDRNVIAGNSMSGIKITSDSCDYNIIQNNYIGTDVHGILRLGNEASGAVISSSFNTFNDNILSGNAKCGIVFEDFSFANLIFDNKIGLQSNGTAPLSNNQSGILFEDQARAMYDTIGPGNRIWNNGQFGIEIQDSTSLRITITQNSISHNDSGAIKLYLGANEWIEAPIILKTSPISGYTRPNSILEIFSDSSDQCETYEGQTVADNDGYWQFDGVVSGPNVKASATDSNGNTSELSHNHVVTHSPENPRIENPDKFYLYQNYPNPFNPVTTIEFSVKSPCMVNLDVYNILGQKVAVLVNKKNPAGFYQVSWNSTGMPAGVYIYQIVMGKHYQFRRKMLLVE